LTDLGRPPRRSAAASGNYFPHHDKFPVSALHNFLAAVHYWFNNPLIERDNNDIERGVP